MDIFKRANSPYWWYRFTINGVLHRASTKRPLNDQKGARKVLAAEYDRLMNRTQFGQKSPITLGEAFDRVVESVDNPKTRQSYDLTRRRVLGLAPFNVTGWWSLPANTPLHTLNEGHLEDMVRSRKKAGNRENTINVDLRVLKRVINFSRKRFMAPDDLDFPMCSHFEKTRFLTRDEEAAILAKLDEHRGSPAYDKGRDLFVYLIDTGVRLGEALNVGWPDIDMQAQRIETFRIKTKSMSMVPIPNRVRELLERRHNLKAPFLEMTRAIRLLRIIVDEVCNNDPRINAQRGKATLHSLRDTYASRLAQKGMSLHKVSKLLGHSSTTMTRKYAHIEPHDVAEEARKMING